MAYHVTYIAKAYNIPPSLLVNSDQTNVHLVPTTREHTWESRVPNTYAFGIEDKRQVTMVVSSFIKRLLLPL
jgi:hypothetical protein